MMDKVSVVMLSFNRKNDVEEGVQELLKQNYKNIEIIVVDNGSSDGTPGIVKNKFPEVKLIALEENIGVAAYNKGFQQAQGKYIVILDDDSFPGPNAIPRMVEEFEKNEKLGVVAFDVRNYYDYKKTNLIRETHEIHEIQEKHEKTETRYQMAFNGAGVGIRKKCISEVGGYPEEFFLYWNEQDLSIRILNAGYQIQWFPDIISLHKYSPSNRESWRAPFYYTRNLYWLTWKYFPLKKCLKDTIKLLYYSLYYTFEQKTAIYLKATMNALFKIGQIKRKPAKKQIIENLRLTYRLPFIYYK
jgi:GT2 family glycosyltransferase